MSIRDEIKKRVEEGRLYPVQPTMDDDPVARTMFVSEDIQRELVGPWENEDEAVRWGWLHADLEAFVKGQIISVCLVPYEHKSAYMGRLDRPEDDVFDVRSRDPDPGVRIFGRFAETDVFIALNWAPRSVEWADRDPLGDATSRQWQFAIIECQQRWSSLFPDHAPLHSERLEDYVSENAFLV